MLSELARFCINDISAKVLQYHLEGGNLAKNAQVLSLLFAQFLALLEYGEPRGGYKLDLGGKGASSHILITNAYISKEEMEEQTKRTGEKKEKNSKKCSA